MAVRNVLWTGGWDSTYRVLKLALVDGEQVQPHYLLHSGRQSTRFELQAIASVWDGVEQRGGLILEPVVEEVEVVNISSEAWRDYQILADKFNLGEQYLWLSEYARSTGIKDLELCAVRDDRVTPVVERWNAWRSEGIESPQMPERLLSRLSFPTLGLSKMDMREDALANSFSDLLELSWFCHLPTRFGKPCGFCNPCRSTVKEGLGDRLPVLARGRGVMEQAIVRHLPSYRLRRGVRELVRGRFWGKPVIRP